MHILIRERECIRENKRHWIYWVINKCLNMIRSSHTYPISSAPQFWEVDIIMQILQMWNGGSERSTNLPTIIQLKIVKVQSFFLIKYLLLNLLTWVVVRHKKTLKLTEKLPTILNKKYLYFQPCVHVSLHTLIYTFKMESYYSYHYISAFSFYML